MISALLLFAAVALADDETDTVEAPTSEQVVIIDHHDARYSQGVRDQMKTIPENCGHGGDNVETELVLDIDKGRVRATTEFSEDGREKSVQKCVVKQVEDWSFDRTLTGRVESVTFSI